MSLLRLGAVVSSVCVIGSITASGCVVEAPGPGPGSSASALISGRVFDAEDNTPVRNATVKMPNGTTTTTDANGYFQVNAQPGKVVVTIDQADHARAVKEVTAYQDASSYTEVFSKPVIKDSTLSAQVGGMAKVADVAVMLPANALQTESGDDYDGMVTVEVATVRPDKPNDLAAFPGTFDGVTLTQQQGTVETRAAASLRLLSASGQPLRVRTGSEVEVFLPIRSGQASGNVPLWRLDDGRADWEQTGETVVDVDPVDHLPALRSTVRAMTWWNAGVPISKSRVSGCLSVPGMGGDDEGGRAGTSGSIDTGGSSAPQMPGGSGGDGERDDGAGDAFGQQQSPLIGDNPLAGIHVVATGLGYGFRVEQFTDDNGCFELDVKADNPVAVFAQTRMLRSAPLRVTAGGVGETQNIGMLPLTDREGDCPGVMVACGSRCVDLLTDDNNCGECGNSCAADTLPSEYPSLVPVHCVYGSCDCDDNQELCEGEYACANIQTDNQHCGGCFNACGEGLSCTGGSCGGGTIDRCENGFVDCAGECVEEEPGCSSLCDPPLVWCGNGCCPGTSIGRACDAFSCTDLVPSGFTACCPEGVDSCGVDFGGAFPDIEAAPCVATDYGARPSDLCPFENEAQGCCRADGRCGLIVPDDPDLGCVLREHVGIPPLLCGSDAGDAGVGGAGAGGAGAGGAGAGGADAGVDPPSP